MSISSSAMLAELNISVWTAVTTEKRVTDQVLAQAQADASAGQFKKNLMAGTSKRKEIADFAQSCRHWHMARTLPWLDKGGRLLPTSLFLDYKTEVNTRRAQFDRMVDEFIGDYQALVAQAQGHLGGLFDADDYPPTDVVRHKFGFRLVFSPVPEAGDFRIAVGEGDLKELQEQYEENYSSRLGEAMQSAWERLHGVLTSMSGKLTESEDKKRYHDSLLGNAQELCAMLTHLNVTGDPKLEQARKALEGAIFRVDIEDIKLDPGVRLDVKTKLDAVLKDYW